MIHLKNTSKKWMFIINDIIKSFKIKCRTFNDIQVVRNVYIDCKLPEN